MNDVCVPQVLRIMKINLHVLGGGGHVWPSSKMKVTAELWQSSTYSSTLQACGHGIV